MTPLKVIFFLSLSVCLWACATQPYAQGKRIYDAYCLQCHMADGNGLGELYPSLIGSSYLLSDIDKLACLIRNGQQSEALATVYMPAHKSLTPADVTNLINYISSTWGDREIVKIADITEQMNNCP